MTQSLFIQRDASISACGRYRWMLSRAWERDLAGAPWCGWIMLNPSTADANDDDPTIRRCMNFSKDWGFGGMSVVNLFAWRATDPKELLTAVDPIGRGGGRTNDDVIAEMADGVQVIVAAWGALGSLHGRDRAVHELLTARGAALHCLGTTAAGHPKHPLYVNGKTKLVPFELPAGGRA